MESKYILKEVDFRSESKEKDGLELAIREGDIIFDNLHQFKVLPAALDFPKPITRKKVSNTPFKQSERLLRIKELGEDSVVVAILHQETSCEGEDTLVTIETEELVTVQYGEKFSVYAKEQVFDSPFPVSFRFVITKKSQSPKRNVPNFCTECGRKLTEGARFCNECGTPVNR